MNHTPKPWKYIQHKNEWASVFPADGDTKPAICRIVTRGKYRDDPVTEEDRANGLLMAAAPDLLEALKNLVELHSETPSMLTAEDWDRAVAAIKKAEGE